MRIGGGKEEARKPVTAIEEATAREEDAWQKLQRNVEEMGQQIEQLQQQAQGAGGGAMSAEQKAQMEDTVRGIERSAAEIKQAMGDAEARMKAGDLVDQQMAEKMAELHKLADEVLDKDLKAVERLRDMMKEPKAAGMRADAEKLRQLHDKLMRELARTVDLLKRAKGQAVLDALQSGWTIWRDGSRPCSTRRKGCGPAMRPRRPRRRSRASLRMTPNPWRSR